MAAQMNFNVVIISDDEIQRRLYVLPGHTSIGAVRQRYTADIGLDIADGSFIDDEGSSIADDRSVAEMAGDGPGRQIVALTFEERTKFRLEVEDVWEKLSVTLDVFPEDQWQEVIIKLAAAIEEAAEDRLLVLESDDSEAVSTSSQSPSSRSDVDEESSLLLSHTNVGEVRLFHGGQRLVLRGTVEEALMRCGAPRQHHFLLRLERQRTVVMTKGSKPSVHQVWPTDTVSELSNGRAAWSDGRVIQQQETMFDIDLVEEGIIVADPLILTLKVLDGDNVTVRAPKWATVGDVRRAAGSLSQNRKVHLRRGKTILDDDHVSLQQAGLVEEPSLIVDAEIVTVSVDIKSLNIDETTWCPTKRILTFDDLINDIMERTGASEAVLKRTVFACVGCGRRLWREEASMQTLPVKCCIQESRRLTEWTPPRQDKWDAAEMADKWKKIEEVEDLKQRLRVLFARLSYVQRENEEKVDEMWTLEGKVELYLNCNKRLSDSNKELLQQSVKLEKENEDLKKVLAVERVERNKISKEKSALEQKLKQQEEVIDDVLQQKGRTRPQEEVQKKTPAVSGATAGAARVGNLENAFFFIQNGFKDFNNGISFSVVLWLSPTPTVGEVRASIAQRMNRHPERTGLRLRVARSNGEEVFRFRSGTFGGYYFSYKDADGNDRRKVTEEEEKILTTDDDPFPIKFVNGWENEVIVFPQDPTNFLFDKRFSCPST